MHFAIEIQGDNGHSGGKASHRLSKLRGIQAHCRRDVACRVSHHFFWCRRLRRSQPRLYGCRRLPYHAPPLYHSSNVTRTAITLATPRQRSACASALDAVRPGIPISRESALHLIRCSEDELPELLVAARAVKERFKPAVITYSRKVFLPLTNLCRDYCGYCTFRRNPGGSGAHTMTPDEVMEVVRAGERMGCAEALFSLGDKPELLFPEMRDTLRHFGYRSTLHYLEAMCEKVLRESSLLPHPNPGLMSAEWLERLARVAPSMGLMLETTSARLLVKDAAHDNAPDKDPAKRLRVIEDAGQRKIPFTTGILMGIGETLEERLDSLIAIRY